MQYWEAVLNVPINVTSEINLAGDVRAKTGVT
jgi:hypothetical protein